MEEQAPDRARQLLQVFGEVLPESSTDDRPDDSDQSSHDRDGWLLENRPPHHDQEI